MATTNDGSEYGDAGRVEASDHSDDRDDDEASEYEEREYESSEHSEASDRDDDTDNEASEYDNVDDEAVEHDDDTDSDDEDEEHSENGDDEASEHGTNEEVVLDQRDNRDEGSEPVVDTGEGSESVDTGEDSEPVVDTGEDSEQVDTDEGSERVVDRGESSEPVVDRGEGSEPVVDRGESSERVVDTGEGSEPFVDTGEGSEPVVDTGEGSEPVVDRGESSEPVVDTGEGSEPVDTGEDSEPVDREESLEQGVNKDEASEDMRASQEAASKRGDNRTTGYDAAAAEKRAFLKCPLCLDYYIWPKLLPCSHTFCLGCLQNLKSHLTEDDTTFPCPQCRAEIPIPPGGMPGLQNNFYLRNEDLEAARLGVHCLTHRNQDVDLYCKDCQQPMCVKCALTKHKLHTIENLFEVAIKAKQELFKIEKCLKDTARLVEQFVAEDEAEKQALKDKQAAVEIAIKSRHAAVIAMADKTRDEQLASLKENCSKVKSTVRKELDTRKKYLQGVTELQQRLQEAVTKGTPYLMVNLAKEIREERGNTYDVNRMTVRRSKIIRPVLDFTTSLNAHMLKLIENLGKVDMVEMEVSPHEVEVKAKFKCCEEENTEVYCLCPLDNKIWVSYESSGLANFLGDCFDKDGTHQYSSRYSGKTSRKYSRSDHKCLCLPPLDGEIRTYAKSINLDGYHELLHYRKGKSAIRRERQVSDEVKSNKTIFPINAGPHRAFDIDSTRKFFVVVEEPQGTDHRRKVKLFLRNKPDPVVSYTSPSQPFNPSDVCFLFLGGQEVLAIADEVGDSIHVVKVETGTMTFLRYLAPGCPLLVQPTALNTDLDGLLWVACRGSRLITMTPNTR